MYCSINMSVMTYKMPVNHLQNASNYFQESGGFLAQENF